MGLQLLSRGDRRRDNMPISARRQVNEHDPHVPCDVGWDWQPSLRPLLSLSLRGHCCGPPESVLNLPVYAIARAAIEVDAFRQVPPIEFAVSTPEGEASLGAFMKTGGVEARIFLNQVDIPFQEASGPLDESDLYQLVSHWRDRNPVQSTVDARLYALMTTALMSNNGEPLFGMMFDVAGREGLADNCSLLRVHRAGAGGDATAAHVFARAATRA